MKKLTLALLIFSASVVNAQVVLWSEDFTGEPDGAVAGTATGGTWSVTASPPGTFSKQTVAGSSLFQINDTGSEGVFETSSIDISGTGMATISLQCGTFLTNAADYIRAYYKVDGGPEILFAEFLGTSLDVTAPVSAIVAGNNLQVIIRASENTPGDVPLIGIPIMMGFDDLTVTSVPVLYNCLGGPTVWDAAESWSTIGFTGPCDAPAPPTVGQVAIIGGNGVMHIAADANVGGVDIRNDGTLQYTASLVDLGIEMGFFRVQNGGELDRNGQTAAHVDFTQDVGGARFEVEAGGTAVINAITLTNNASNIHYLEGGGSLTITDRIIIDASDATLINNMTVPLVISSSLEFTAGTTGSTFENNGTLGAVGGILFDDDNNFFINNSIAVIINDIAANDPDDDDNTIINNSGASLTFVNLNGSASTPVADGGDLTILNSGTINQAGTFLNIANNATALNDINNLAGATWNYAGTGHDTDIRLFANNGTNDFNYIGTNQQIITPVTGNGYSNLNLEGSDFKTALDNFSVYGNWSSTGTATFAAGPYTVTFSGTSPQTISSVDVDGTTFTNLTLNNTAVSAPQITLNGPVTVHETLNMVSGIVDLAGTTFTLGNVSVASTLIRTASTTTNWMYGGSFRRHWLDGVAVSGTAGERYGLFPLGSSSASSYRPVEVNSTVSPATGGIYTVTHADVSGTTDLSPVFDDGGTNIVRKHNAQFDGIVSGAVGGVFNISATMTDLSATGNLSDIRLAVSNGATTVTTVGTHVTATGTVSNPTAIRNGVLTNNLTGDFRISTANLVNTPLPVELVSFRGEVVENTVPLHWETASELNNDFFTVERSEVGEVFSGIGQVNGSGTTNQGNKYLLIDHNPIYGTVYYRLKQTDFDGTFTYSKIIAITYEGSVVPVMDVYPNPSGGDQFNIKISGLKNVTTVPVVMYDQLGRECVRLTLNVDESSGTAFTTFFPEKGLPKGIYMLKAGSLMFTKRLVIIEK